MPENLDQLLFRSILGAQERGENAVMAAEEAAKAYAAGLAAVDETLTRSAILPAEQ